ncbi:helix-turn-helix domain-containing protein [Streptomyces coeruleorubidus]|uniref:helix-turn-helix domain-containing protein n=1 Tax=Streptomyces coeruleorubidus TaxID=116188 RepID=UPI0036FBD063
MSIVLSTASVPAAERLDYWHEVISQTYDQLASVRLNVSTPTEAPYNGVLRSHQIGSMQVATTEADPLQVRQTTRGVAGADTDYLSVCLQERGLLVIDQADSQTLLRPGSLTFFDTVRPYTVSYPEPFRMHVIQVPRWMVGVREADLRRVTAVSMDTDSETAALVIPFLSRLATRAASHPQQIGDLLVRNAADLLTTLVTERMGRDVTDTDATLRLRVKTFMDRHLADPGLSPQTIAAAHHMSVRHLHRLFEAEETTVSRWIQHRRLEACRRELGRPGRHGPAVTAIAHRFGFSSPTSFSRAFRAAYGMSPREWRAAAHRDQTQSDTTSARTGQDDPVRDM